MKFYFRQQINKRNSQTYSVAHVVKEEAEARGNCLCRTTINPEKWLLVEGLPQGVHLCRRCELLVFGAIQKFTHAGDEKLG